MPRRANPNEKVRMTLELTKPIREQLERMQRESQADSLAEVIRRALAVYDLMLEVNREGAKVIATYKDGSKERLRVL